MEGTGVRGDHPGEGGHVGGGRERSIASAVASQLGAVLGGGGGEEAEFSTPTQGRGQPPQWPPPEVRLPAAHGFSLGPPGGTKRVAGGSPGSAYQEQLLAKARKGQRQGDGQPAPGGTWRGGGSRLKSFLKKKPGAKAPPIAVKAPRIGDVTRRAKSRLGKAVSKEGASKADGGLPSFTPSEEAPLHEVDPGANAPPQDGAPSEGESTALELL